MCLELVAEAANARVHAVMARVRVPVMWRRINAVIQDFSFFCRVKNLILVYPIYLYKIFVNTHSIVYKEQRENLSKGVP